MIQEMKLGHHVSLLGFRPDALQLLQGADLFLHTAVKDPHPRSVVEAMAMGLPVVAFAVDGVVETVVDNQTGYLVRTEDISGLATAILKLATDSSLRTQFGCNGRHRVEECFSAEGTARQVGNIIAGTLGTVRR